MRLQVFISHCGVCSRRKALSSILSGQVTVNGKKILEPSYCVNPSSDIVTFGGRKIFLLEKAYIILNKPKGVVTTTKDRFAEKKVTDLLPSHLKHLYPVGRLDKETTGLLLMTNDGELAHRLTHPSFEVNKTYKVRLSRPLSEIDKNKLQKGVFLDGKKTLSCKITKTSQNELEIVLREGRKRQVRRMFASLSYHVVDLRRIAEGALTLGHLKPGEWRFLKKEEIQRLYHSGSIEKKAFSC